MQSDYRNDPYGPSSPQGVDNLTKTMNDMSVRDGSKSYGREERSPRPGTPSRNNFSNRREEDLRQPTPPPKDSQYSSPSPRQERGGSSKPDRQVSARRGGGPVSPSIISDYRGSERGGQNDYRYNNNQQDERSPPPQDPFQYHDALYQEPEEKVYSSSLTCLECKRPIYDPNDGFEIEALNGVCNFISQSSGFMPIVSLVSHANVILMMRIHLYHTMGKYFVKDITKNNLVLNAQLGTLLIY